MVGVEFVFGPDTGGVRCMDGQQLFRISVILLCRGRYPKAFLSAKFYLVLFYFTQKVVHTFCITNAAVNTVTYSTRMYIIIMLN